MKIIGPWNDPTIHSENPGTVYLTSSDPSIASVENSVIVPGTRAWRRGIAQGFNGPVGASAATASRDSVTICFDVDVTDFVDNYQNYSNQINPVLPIAQSYSEGGSGNLLNWGFAIRTANRAVTAATHQLIYSQTTAPPVAGAVGSVRNLSLFDGFARFVVTLDDVTITVYWHNGISKLSNIVGRSAPTGNVANPIFAIYGAQRFAYFNSVLADDATGVDVWLAGNCPASPVVYYPCNEEVPDSIAAAPYDSSTNIYDGIFSGDATYPLTSAPRTYTDDPLDPVVPYQAFTVTPNSTGTFTITARRRRYGVPDRATDEEKWEETSETFTIVSMPSETTEYVRLLISTSQEGVVDIVSSDPLVVTFPSSVSVGPTLQFEVLGTVVGAGTSTITTSMDGTELGTTTVTIEDAPTVIHSGPDQQVRSRLP